MISVLAVCGAGMGTSLIVKMNVQKFLDENNIEAKVESCGLSEVCSSNLDDVDILLASSHLVDNIEVQDRSKIIPLTNIMDSNEYGPLLLDRVSKLKTS